MKDKKKYSFRSFLGAAMIFFHPEGLFMNVADADANDFETVKSSIQF